MKKIINFVLVLCLILPSIFLLSACSSGEAGSVAGTYSNSFIADGVRTDIVVTIKKDGSFTYSTKTSEGLHFQESKLSGNLSVDSNKKVTNCSLTNLDSLLSKNASFLGNLLPEEEIPREALLEVTLLGSFVGDAVKECFKFTNDYMIICSTHEPMVLYKNGVEKYAKDSVLHFFSEKGMMDLLNALNIFDIDTKPVNYKTDYYFSRSQYDLNTDAGKQSLLEYLNNYSKVMIADYLGNAELTYTNITKFANFDLSTTGEKTGTITYMSAGKEVNKEVTYTVLKDESDHPKNEITSYELYDSSKYTLKSVEFIAKDTELYNLNWKFGYKAENSSSNRNYEDINEENCTGDNKTVTISGYNKATAGYQLVSVEYRGKIYKQAVFVYDENNNPAFDADSAEGNSVKINKTNDGVKDVYSLDCSNTKIVLYYANGTSETKNLTSNQAINLDDLKNYENDDTITFAYNYTYNEQTYTFYVNAKVVVNY